MEDAPPFRIIVVRDRNDPTAAYCPLCHGLLTLKPQWARCRVLGGHLLLMRRVYLPCRKEVLVQCEPVRNFDLKLPSRLGERGALR
jgi:hypothetical protein